MKRVLSLFLSFVMIFSVFQVAFPAFALEYDFSIVLSESEITLNTDEGGKHQHTLTVTYVDKDNNPIEVPEDALISWDDDSDKNIAMVEVGEVTAKKNGECTVTATVCFLVDGDVVPTDISAECKVTVRNTINTFYKELQTALDDIPEDYETSGVYLQNTVDALKAVVDSIEYGLADSNENCEKVKQWKEDVISATEGLKEHTTAIIITDYPEEVTVGDEDFTITFDVTGYDDVEWESSDETVATIDNEGKVTILGGCSDAENNFVTFTVSSYGFTDSCQIKVNNPINRIDTDEAEYGIYTGEINEIKINAYGKDENAPITHDYSFTWSSTNEDVAVIEDGSVKALSAGETEITVKYSDEIYTTFTLKVTDPTLVEGVEWNEKPERVTVGFGVTASLTILPADATYTLINWTSSAEDIVKVEGISAEGNIASVQLKGISAGTATITYRTTDGTDIEGSFEIEVIPYSGVKFSEENITLNTDEYGKKQTQLTLVYLDDNGDVVEFSGESDISWDTESSEIATVDENGNVTAVSNGVCEIYATDALTGKTAVCKVTVRDSILKLYADYEAVKATIPEDYKDATRYVSTVADALDAVLAQYVGELEDTDENCETVINLAASLEAAIEELLDAEIASSDDEEFWGKWKEAYAYMPEDKDAYFDDGIAVLEDIAETVYGEDSSKIWLKKDKAALDKLADDFLSAFAQLRKHTTALTITDAPENVLFTEGSFSLSWENDGYDEVTWSSDDEDVATIDNEGNVTIHCASRNATDPTVTFTVTSANGISASCKVGILNPIASAKFKESSAIAYIGVPLDLNENLELVGVDEDAPVTAPFTIEWTTSSGAAATVEDGIVTGIVANGQSIIGFVINSDPNLSGVCSVIVKKVVNASEINPVTIPTRVTAGQSVIANVEVLPSNTSFPELEWISFDTNIASVKSAGTEGNVAFGEITGVSEGTVHIMYRTTDGTNLSGTFVLTVLPDREITIEPTEVTLNLDKYGTKSAVLRAVFTDVTGTAAADPSLVEWSSSDITKVSVVNGVVTAKENGVCYVYATDKTTGKKASCQVTIRDTIKTYYEHLDMEIKYIPADFEDETKYDKTAIDNLKAALEGIDWELTDSQENCNIVKAKRDAINSCRTALENSKYAPREDDSFWGKWNEAFAAYYEVGDLVNYTDETAEAVNRIIEIVNGEDPENEKKWFTSQKAEIDNYAQQLLDALDNLQVKTSSIEITECPEKWSVGGESFAVYYDRVGFDKVVWTVSDSNVLSVEDAVDENGRPYGKVTVLGGCEDASDPYVTITATSGDYSSSKQIKIINPVASIKLSKSVLTLYTNTTEQLEIVKTGVDPTKPVVEDNPPTAVWSSSNESFVKVSQSGLVTPVAAKPGQKITVTYGDMTAECRVTVVKVEPIQKLTPYSIPSYVTVNTSTNAKVIIYPAYASINKIDWKSSDDKIATVVSTGTDGSGLASASIIGISAGKATITYSATDGSGVSGSFVITVNPLISSIALDKTSMQVYIGDSETYKLNTTILPADAGNQILRWESSDESVAKVTNGKIEIISVGTATITAYATDGTGCSASCELTVLGDAASMTINKTSSGLKVGQTLQLSSEVITKQGVTYAAPIWESSDNSIATVDSKGIVTAKLPGKVTISAKSYDGMTKSCTVTVTADLYGISLPDTMTLAISRSKVVTPTYDPYYATNKNVTWKTSDSSVATVDANGKVTAINVGTAIITATSQEGGYVANCRVSVVRPVTSISISKSSYSLTMGEKTAVTLTATVNPSNATNKKVVWKSSNTKVATVDATGRVKAVGPGTANITVTTVDGGYSRTCKITVIQPVTGVKFSTASKTMYVGQKSTFKYTINPTNATNKDVSFKSSNKKIATVDANGKVTAKKKGSCKIYITTDDGSYKATRKVKVVKKVDVKSVKLNITKKSLSKGNTLTLKPTIKPSNASNKKVTWKSSDTSIATVNTSGVVTAKKGGTVTITCTTKDKKKVATCKVTVYEGVKSITLSATSMTLVSNKSKTLKATVSPETATNKSISWSSNNTSIATVNSKGKVKAIKAGTVYITAKSKDNGSVVAKCKVTVVQAPTKITLNYGEVDLKSGGKITLTPTVTPASSFDKSVTWYSNKPSVARVSDNGVVTAMKAGTATITCSSSADSSIKRSCVVTVVEPVLGVSLSTKNMTMTVGRTKKLVPTISPSNATNKGVRWTSSDKSVAEVNKKGKVEAVGPGEATITCTTKDGLYVAKCKVNVIQSVISVRLNKTSMTLPIGDTKTLTATIKPKDATNQEVIWRSSNSKIARVTQSGRVTALKEGTVKISCTSEDGGIVAVCTVKCVIPVEGVSLNKTSVTIKKGKTFRLKAEIYPSDATIKDVKWSSSNKKIATIDKNGKITAKKKGTVTITCKTKNGGYKITCKVKVKK